MMEKKNLEKTTGKICPLKGICVRDIFSEIEIDKPICKGENGDFTKCENYDSYVVLSATKTGLEYLK